MKVLLQKNKYRIAAVGYIIWALFFIFQSSFITINGERYFCLFDDAMISMRYAWNLSHGNGIVFNPGELVEGYTNFLMVMGMSIFTGLFNDKMAVLGVQIFGIFIVLAIGRLTVAIVRKVLSKKTAEDVGFPIYVLILLYYPLSYWSLMGMETGLLTLLVLLAFYFIITYRDSREIKHLIFSGAFLGLAGITRLDIIILSIPLALYLVLLEAKNGFKKTFSALLVIGFSCAIFPLGNFIFRYFYYGQLLPNTYYLKLTGMAAGTRLRNGFNFIITFLFETLPLWMLAVSCLVLNYSKERLAAFLTIGILATYQVWVGGDAWYYWRFLMPGIPMLFIIAIEELWYLSGILGKFFFTPFMQAYRDRNPIWASVKSSRTVRTIGEFLFLLAGLGLLTFSILPGMIGAGKQGFGLVQASGFLFAFFLVFLGILISTVSTPLKERKIHRSFIIGFFVIYFLLNYRFLAQISFLNKPYQVPSNRTNVNIALALDEVTNEDASIGVFWGGALPYYSHRYTVDFLGKADPYIASLEPDTTSNIRSMPGHNKYDLTYSIQHLKPTYVAGFAWGSQDLSEWQEENYSQVTYKGTTLNLLNGAEEVNWDLVR